MVKNGSNKDVIELWGRHFKRAKSGLDEEQVESFVNGLISERDMLLKRQEHLSSLSELAERTVAEADNIAKQVKEKAEDQAQAEAKAIVAKAEEQAQQMIEEKRAEAIAIAEREAEAIKASAQQQAELLLEEKTKKIQSELRDTAQRLFRELLSQLESLKQQVTVLEADFGRTLTLSQPAQTKPAIVEKKDDITPATDSEVSLEISGSILAEALEQVRTVNQSDTSVLEKEAIVSAENQEMTEYDGKVELLILPPTDIKKVMGIMIYLESLPEVETTELVPLTDKPLIIVFLREPMHLIEILETLPEVGQAREITDGEVIGITGDAPDEGKRRKIEITLSGNFVLDGTKERSNSEVPRNVSL